MASREDLIAAVRRSWSERIPEVAFDPEVPLLSLGVDSVTLTEVIVGAEDLLGEELPFDRLEDIDENVTVGDLVERLSA